MTPPTTKKTHIKGKEKRKQHRTEPFSCEPCFFFFFFYLVVHPLSQFNDTSFRDLKRLTLDQSGYRSLASPLRRVRVRARVVTVFSPKIPSSKASKNVIVRSRRLTEKEAESNTTHDNRFSAAHTGPSPSERDPIRVDVPTFQSGSNFSIGGFWFLGRALQSGVFTGRHI